MSFRDNDSNVRLLGTVKEKTEQGIVIKITDQQVTEVPLKTCKTHEGINMLLGVGRKGLMDEFGGEAYKKKVEARKKAMGRAIEACCDYSDDVVADCVIHPLIYAVQLAYNDHRPLVLSPDIIWLAIAQGVALHVNENAEKLRKIFVSHEGKQKIIVRRDDFQRLSPENPWREVFSAFTEKIKAYIGDKNYGMMVRKFSTTSPVEQAAYEVALMDGMQQYFAYEFQTMCGIPEVNLLGKTEDWNQILTALDDIATLELDWWTDHLKAIVLQLRSTSEGKIDAGFWDNMFKEGGGSGGPYISGWIADLFPYMKDWQGKHDRNRKLGKGSERAGMGGLTTASFVSGRSMAPFEWVFPGQKFDYEFIGGFVGIKQDNETMALTPKIGWAIREAAEK